MQSHHTLATGQAQSLPPATQRLRVLQGALWLTAEGWADDHFVGAGQRLELSDARRVVVQAQGQEPARFLLNEPARDNDAHERPRNA